MGGSLYIFVVVDDYSRFTRVDFLKYKSVTINSFSALCKKIQNQLRSNIVYIRSDHGRKFENFDFINFCDLRGISQNFCDLYIFQSNGGSRKEKT